MNLDNLKNPVVKSAIEAFQKGDIDAWLVNFTRNTELYDDGSRLDFLNFTSSVAGRQYFSRIDRVENDGKDVYGHLCTRKWGSFDVYFKFHINEENKIYRLDIGHVAKIYKDFIKEGFGKFSMNYNVT